MAQDPEDEVRDFDGELFGLGHRSGRFGLAACGVADVVARAGAGLDQAARLEQVVGLEYGRGIDATAAAGSPDRRDPLAGPQLAGGDRLGDLVGEGFVAFHGRRGAARGRWRIARD